MLKTYPAIFHKEGTGYWVEFPEFGGGTEGKNIDEGMALPTPSDILKIEVSDGFVSMIQVDPAPFVRSNKAIRKNVTVPEWLVRLADREKINYSEVLAQALEKKLQV